MIYIVADTNFLNISFSSNADFTKWQMNGTYYQLLKCRKNGAVDFLLPEIVLRELKQHKIEAFEKHTNVIRKIEENCKGLFSVQYAFSNKDYCKYLDSNIDDFLNGSDSTTLLPVSVDSFDTIVNDCISKRPPFEGVKGKADKGFKDELIICSMIEYAKKHIGTYCYLTEDKAFGGNNRREISNRFNLETKSELKIFSILDELLMYLDSSLVHGYVESLEIDIVNKHIVFTGYPLKNEVCIKQQMPRVHCLSNARSIEKINNEIERLFNEACRWLNELDFTIEKEKYEKEEGFYPFEDEFGGEISTRILFNESGLVSFLFEGYDYLAGSCHGDCTQKGVIFDNNSGEIVGLTSLLFLDDEKVLEIAKEAVIRASKENGESSVDAFDKYYHSADDIRFYLDKEGIHGFFDVYEAGCYADGFVEYLIYDAKQTSKIVKEYSKFQKQKYDTGACHHEHEI